MNDAPASHAPERHAVPSRRAPWHALVAVLLFAWATADANAALQNCAAIEEFPGEYKVVLDQFAPPSATPTPAARLGQRLKFQVDAQVRALRNSALAAAPTRPLSLRLVTCTNRQPAIDGSDFTPSLAERLSDSRVVLEVWGEEDLGEATPTLRVGFVIPPLQFYEPAVAAASTPALAFPRANSADPNERLRELEAFVLAGVATKAARARQYDTAVWAFNQARARIAGATHLAGELAALDAHLARAACLARARARADPNYRGPLRLAPAPACGAPP